MLTWLLRLLFACVARFFVGGDVDDVLDTLSAL